MSSSSSFSKAYVRRWFSGVVSFCDFLNVVVATLDLPGYDLFFVSEFRFSHHSLLGRIGFRVRSRNPSCCSRVNRSSRSLCSRLGYSSSMSPCSSKVSSLSSSMQYSACLSSPTSSTGRLPSSI